MSVETAGGHQPAPRWSAIQRAGHGPTLPSRSNCGAAAADPRLPRPRDSASSWSKRSAGPWLMTASSQPLRLGGFSLLAGSANQSCLRLLLLLLHTPRTAPPRAGLLRADRPDSAVAPSSIEGRAAAASGRLCRLRPRGEGRRRRRAQHRRFLVFPVRRHCGWPVQGNPSQMDGA